MPSARATIPFSLNTICIFTSSSTHYIAATSSTTLSSTPTSQPHPHSDYLPTRLKPTEPSCQPPGGRGAPLPIVGREGRAKRVYFVLLTLVLSHIRSQAQFHSQPPRQVRRHPQTFVNPDRSLLLRTVHLQLWGLWGWTDKLLLLHLQRPSATRILAVKTVQRLQDSKVQQRKAQPALHKRQGFARLEPRKISEAWVAAGG